MTGQFKPCRECGAARSRLDVVRGGGVRCAVCRSRGCAPKPTRIDEARAARMCRLYREGFTLQKIGTVFGITRERVRQIIGRQGLKRDAGGQHRQIQMRKQRALEARRERADIRSRAWFGCDHETMLALNNGKNAWAKGHSKSRAFIQQKRHAAYRGVEWRLTFPEWCRIWDESGKWPERGRGRNGYVMARIQDFGPYAAWNVQILTGAQNVSDYQAELKRRGVECADGYKRLPERAIELGIAA